jgi:dolichyl-phosphate beta-glucosyltransferase
VVAPSFFRYIYTRHNVGRLFNHLVRATAVRGLRDTQAGLKAMPRAIVEQLVPLLRMDGFSFDVELLHAAQRQRLRVVEVPVTYVYAREPTTVQLARDSLAMARDIARIRARSARGAYDARVAEPAPTAHAGPGRATTSR